MEKHSEITLSHSQNIMISYPDQIHFCLTFALLEILGQNFDYFGLNFYIFGQNFKYFDQKFEYFCPNFEYFGQGSESQSSQTPLPRVSAGPVSLKYLPKISEIFLKCKMFKILV